MRRALLETGVSGVSEGRGREEGPVVVGVRGATWEDVEPEDGVGVDLIPEGEWSAGGWGMTG